MGKIQSDFSTAQQIATKMNSSLNLIKRGKGINVQIDGKTNLTVVTAGKSINTKLKSSVQQYSSGLKQFMTDLKSVAASFEGADKEAGNQFGLTDVVKDASTFVDAVKGKK